MTAGAPSADGRVARAMVEAAVGRLTADVADLLERTGLPGLALAVVFDDEVVHAQGFGVRQLGQPDQVDADTVFQLASLSKSVGSSAMAALVGEGVISWNDPVRSGLPELQLSDPWVSERVTYADLYSHRSGLPEHVGDLLEDIGYGRAEVLERLRYERLDPFRTTYAYTNFGLTAAGEAAARKAGTTWEELSKTRIYDPLGMTSTSSLFADFLARPNRATGHVPSAKGSTDWLVTAQPRQPDAQSPAGGVSSSVNDLARWMRMQIDGGSYEGTDIVDPAALAETHHPQIMARAPRSVADRPGWYGLGLNVGYDDAGRVRLGHSGAFALGAGTAFSMLPVEKLGIVVLTNGAPLGIAEAVCEGFMEDATTGTKSRDWFAFIGPYFDAMLYPEPEHDYAAPPGDAAPAAALGTYVGTYRNESIGEVEVTESDGVLEVTLGPAGLRFPLDHFAGDEFSWQFTGENAGPRAPVTFSSVRGGIATALTLATFDKFGRGRLTRI